jgi:dipeptidyl aminopeptidase/acylaminoacyl peptidase
VDVMAHGADFYANLCLSPDGTKVAWLQWDHPWMPWDRNELWVADLTKDHDFINAKQLFSGHQEAFYQPSWNSKNQLFVCSDRTGYWNLYCVMHDELFILFQKKADFGRALWTLGTRCYSFLSHHEIILCYCEQGIWHTGYFNTVTNLFSEINNGLTCLHNIASDEICTAFLGGHPFLSLSVCGAKNTDLKNLKIIRTSAEYELSCEFISKPEMIKFPTRDHKAAFVIYYPPCHPHYCAPPDTSPPLILKVHGGPTSSADYLLNPKALFYTSRGYAYAEINYRGSTGYGKDFRKSLTGKWGSQDVEDCADCILYLCEKGKADQKKLILSGSSSGGTTVLKSLACFDIYACASCSYGISDFISMRNHIHKFEAFYDETLLGASFETERHVYSKKSPLFVAHKIRSPVIFFHGDCDVVVDVTQTYQMAQALAKRSVYHEVYIFQDEGHGFKKAENIAAVLRKEFEFFKKFIEKE